MYPCPCCGYMTLMEKPPGTYLICPICFWEDSAIENEPGSNGISLWVAQQNFITFGACDRQWLNDVRTPTDADRRDPNWQTLQEKAHAATSVLIAQITQAFEGVTRDDGVSLHEARAIDDYEGPQGRAEARQQDTDTRWPEIPDQWIEEFSDVLNFFDAKGFRYYIPAYMIWVIKNYQITRSSTVDFTIYALCIWQNSGVDYDVYHRFRLLNQQQSEAIREFLKFMAIYGKNWADSKAAKKALNQYWNRENLENID